MREMLATLFVFGLTGLLIAATPRHAVHSSQDKVDEEFDAIYQSMQDQQFNTHFGTPTASSLFMGRIFISSTGTIRFCTAVDSITVKCTPPLETVVP